MTKSLDAIASIYHLTSYGRLLWRIYCPLSCERKISGTSLALLASRICLGRADARPFAAPVDRIVVGLWRRGGLCLADF